MKYFLAKTEPGEYSIDDLAKGGITSWSGVSNPLAMKYLREMRTGDLVLIYHSGKQKAIVGMAEVIEEGQVPKFKFVKKFVEPFVTLKQIKESKKFNDFKLVRQSRLSTMEVSTDCVQELKDLGVDLA